MQTGKPSRTAFAAAGHRAAHQVLERGAIFADPLAVPILGEDAETVVREAEEQPTRRLMRMFIAVRTRFAEDALGAAVRGGVRQLVVLGAGLDTFAYRSPFGEKLRIFEVDYPATQEWKRGRLAEAEIAVPEWLTFAPVDFERQSLNEGLAAAGFDPSVQTFFTWLGVVPYLSGEAIWATLGFIAGVGGGAHVVFDYSDPPETLSAEMRALHDARAARVEAAGEAWVSYFDAEKLRERLMGIGFREVEDLGPAEIAVKYFPERARKGPNRGGHIVRAGTI
jgi:methyltransferase (TIGR00027 family)